MLPAASAVVRRTANLHTGGTIHDVTAELHPELGDGGRRRCGRHRHPGHRARPDRAAAEGPDYVFIEANERPGLANHEPQPTAERFVDLLFPRTAATPWAWQPDPVEHA